MAIVAGFANFPPVMKNLRLLLLCGFVTSLAACEKHPYSDLEKLEKEHKEETPAQSEKHTQYKPASAHPVLLAELGAR